MHVDCIQANSDFLTHLVLNTLAKMGKITMYTISNAEFQQEACRRGEVSIIGLYGRVISFDMETGNMLPCGTSDAASVFFNTI